MAVVIAVHGPYSEQAYKGKKGPLRLIYGIISFGLSSRQELITRSYSYYICTIRIIIESFITLTG